MAKKEKAEKITKTAKRGKPSFDFNTLADQFRSMDPKDPGTWPIVPRIIVLVGVFIGLMIASWFIVWKPLLDELDIKRAEETKLKEQWFDKKSQAVHLEEYKRQLAEIDRSFGFLLKQLPSKSEMDALLIDINQVGIARGLQFNLFKPQTEIKKEFYAEVPITIKLTGNFHDMGAFSADLAKLSRIVTLTDVLLTAPPPTKEAPKTPNQQNATTNISIPVSPMLTLEGVARTYRYLDEEEIVAQKKAESDKKKAAVK